MIRRLSLCNWRSYEDLDMQLDRGTTFVVAPNGVGKTSLVYGLAWAVFGQHSSVDLSNCIRAGASRAEVRVDIDLPDGRSLNICRTAKRRGAPSATYKIDGARLPESSALIEMKRAFGIELDVAGRLSTMLGGGHLASRDDLNLESHLHHAFGVAHLLDAAETAESVAREAEKSRAALRSTTRRGIENRAALESEMSVLEAEISQLTQRSLELKRIREATATQRSLVERHVALAGELERYEQQCTRLADAIGGMIKRPVAPYDKASMKSELDGELNNVERAVTEITDGSIKVRSVVSAAERAIEMLDGGHSICPTCMRQLRSHERVSAISIHKTQRADARAEARHLDGSLAARQTHAQKISSLLAQLEALHPPAISSGVEDVPSRAAAEALYLQASVVLDDHNQKLGGAQTRLNSLRAEIASDDQILRDEQNLRLAYRREAAALAGARALREAAEHVIQSRIEPLASEVRGRWKNVFTSNGLTFRPDGSITRLRGDEELGWDTLSGGERTWARIVTHLIVMASTTSLPFAWFDEPLEHLDPQLRHAVAATLATATRGGSPRQLLVTTYEHAIAQQLADENDGAEIIAIRESGAH